jgi:Zn-dependent peptidase ImmA (M78 family)
MKDVVNNNVLKDRKTGGRGTDEIKNHVYSLMNRYTIRKGSLTPPIEVSILAELQNAIIIYRHDSKNWVASLMPMGNGFVISVNESFPEYRRRNAICHELAHTFFFDTSGEFPTHSKNVPSDPNEERLCFWAAREMLVPFQLLKSELENLGNKAIYSFEGILTLSRIFVVSPDIIARRLTHDLALLGDNWMILWYSNGPIARQLQPKSLYPSHVSTLISDHFKKMIIEATKDTVVKCLERGEAVEMKYNVGKRKTLRFKVKTEQVVREKLCAISWVSLQE